MDRDVTALIKQMTVAEKTALLAGADLWSTVAIERLGIPAVRLTDGPNGARGPALPAIFQGEPPLPAVCVPCGAGLGATWDVDLIERVGKMLGEETRTKACRVLLAPTVNLHRSPLGGRNFESYSEDPLLAGRIAAAFVRGAQSEGVACTVKHFVGNEAETDRQVADTLVDERTLRELYLLPFEIAVREAEAMGIMTSYNRVNGEYCANSHALLAGVLRDEWGFDGFVVSDWFALADTEAAIEAGLDLEMPGPGRAYGSALEAAVNDGRVDEALLDAAIDRLLRVFEQIGALDDDTDQQPSSEDRPEHRSLARDAAVAATVLLENDGVLPLARDRMRTVALIGPNADQAVIMGGGSASLTCHYLRSPLDALRDRLGSSVQILHESGVDGGIDRAVTIATGADAVIVVVGTDADDETEGADRASMDLPGNQNELVARVLEVAPNAVIVLNTGAPVTTPWADDVRALVQIWFGGQEMADGLVDVLFGERDPGGRLPTTFPRRLEDNPSWGNFPPEEGRVSYGEGVLVGYRWYESRRTEPAFPFGHGLSYTTFEVGQPVLSSATFALGDTLRVLVPVANTGGRPGTQVVQLYVGPVASKVVRPVKELKGFAKVALEPGASTTVEMDLDGRSFARWVPEDPALDAAIARLTTEVPWTQPPDRTADRGWVIDPGRYDLHIGCSSADISHVVTVDVPEGGAVS